MLGLQEYPPDSGRVESVRFQSSHRASIDKPIVDKVEALATLELQEGEILNGTIL